MVITRLAFNFDSEYLPHVKVLDCFFCGAEFPILPVVVKMCGPHENGERCSGGCGFPMCPACILSDTKTFVEKSRTMATEHKRRANRIRRTPKCNRTQEDEDFLDIGNSWEELTSFADQLEVLGNISLVPYYELAVSIAKHHPGKAA